MERRLAVIGCGNMGQAILRGLLESGWASPDEVVATHPDEDRARAIHEALGVPTETDNLEAARGARTILLGVKPQVIKVALKQLRGHLAKDQLVISIAAGISTGFIEYYTGEAPVVRSMPNLPVTVGEGATALSPGTYAGRAEMDRAAAVFRAVGEVVEVPESQMDAVTGLSGTGPMYVFHLLEAMADAGVKMGLSREVASRLGLRTVIGAGRLAESLDLHPAALKDMVTSPGGTAITAHHILRRNAFDAIIMDAVEAATRRSRELGE